MEWLRNWLKSLSNYWRNLNKKTKYIVIGSSIGIVATNLIYSQYKQYKISQNVTALKACGALKQKELQNKQHECFKYYNQIPQTDITKNIINMSAMDIRTNIIKGEIDCKTVILIFNYNAHEKNKSINAILEEHYDTAYNEADKLDKMISTYRDESKEAFEEFIKSKPLLGIPISLKDHYTMNNSDCTCGILAHCNKKYTYDGEMVRLVKHFGGIPFVKTNCAQLNAVYETWNNIIGHTVHYLDNKRVVGGSSGGEAALIGSCSSILGLGSDIGGSLRCPADWCGVISYKPSSSRCMQPGSNGANGGYHNNTTIMPAFGPMGRHMCDIIQFLKVYWSETAFKMDPYMTQIRFRESIYNSNDKLSIGYWYNDGWFMSSKSQRRAIDLSVNVLNNNNNNKYEIVEITDFQIGFEAFELYLNNFSESGMKPFFRVLQGEDLYKGYQTSVNFSQIPDWIKYNIISKLLNNSGEFRMERITKISSKYDKTAQEISKIVWKTQKFRYDFWKMMQNKYGVDLLITAVMPYPAPLIGFLETLLPSTSFCVLQNVLDCATGSYSPICFVKENECDYLNDSMLSQYEKDSFSKEIDKNLKGSVGLPVGVQIFGRPFDDEKVLRVMTDLEKSFKK